MLLVALVATLFSAVPAHASSDQESMMQDDDLLLYASKATVISTLDTMKSLGVDRVRLTIKWSAIAPKPFSYTKPAFNAADPGDYPKGAWDPYDQIVKLAQARGIGVDFNLTAPAPFWATVKGAPNDDAQSVWYPSPQEFGLFATAAGLRYSGGYAPVLTPATTRPAPGLGGTLGGRVTVPATYGPVVPRVSYWSIWNEPNQPGWLLPQAVKSGKSWIDFAPIRYRGLADAAGVALAGSGHGRDTVLIGETAPSGQSRVGTLNAMLPLRFLRDLYCVSKKLKPLKGVRATNLGCPSNGDARAFAAAHPVLFNATGLAHHPYALFYPPATPSPTPDQVTLADLHNLAHTMNTIFSRAGRARVGGVPLYLTEYGYQTKPPDPLQIFSPRQQAAFLNQADYLTFRDPRVKAISQYLLDDDGPNAKVPKGSRFYWSTFQTGLRTSNGTPKPAYSAYRLPVYLTRRRGRKVTLFGIIRPAANGAHFNAKIVFRPARRGKLRTLKTVRVRSSRGSFIVRLRAPAAGTLRVQWNGLHSRGIRVR